MKNKLLHTLLLMSKYTIFGIVLQLMLFNLLIASGSNAQQQIRSVKEVYIEVGFRNASMQEVFAELENLTNYRFFFHKSDFEKSYRFSLSKQRISVADLLLEISKDANISFKQLNENISVKKAASGEINSEKLEIVIQTRTVTGKVTSFEDNEGLPGVNVIEKGTTNGTVTDVQGNYSLNVSDGATLVFSSVGYTSEEIVIGNRSVIDLVMNQDIKQLQELVVVGYGTQLKGDVTGSVASIPKERLDVVPSNNVAQALQGAMPGVAITQNSSGAEGGDFSILVRGRNSIKASNGPLVVLDGIPYSGNVSDINPRDISSVEVLKDASSSAIYGARAANGVILITTEKGNSSKPVISYDGYYGRMDITHLPDLMNGEEYYQFKMARDPSTITATEQENFDNRDFVDYIDLATQTGSQQQHSLSYNVKNDNTSIFVSGSLLDVEGVAVNDQFSRYSLRFNIDQGISDWIKIGTNTQMALSDRSGLPVNFAHAFQMNPLTNPYEEDGRTLTIYPWPEDIYWWNPLENLLIRNQDNTYSVFSNNFIDLDLNFIKGLKFRLNTGTEYTQRKEDQYNGRGTQNGYESRGIAMIRERQNLNYVVENILNYNHTFGKNKIDFTGLYSFQKGSFSMNTINGQGFPSDILTHYQINFGELITVNSNFSKQNIISQMGRINYSFDGRYLLTLTGRRDGYSGFGKEKKYGFFPSLAVGWNLTSEDFIAQINAISFLKLRASYGKNGNQAIDPYQTLARMVSSPYLDGANTAPGFIPTTLDNTNLGWETTTSINVGVDYGFLDERLKGSINYYNANTTDLLLDRSISTVHGITSITQNIGKTRNTGVEFDINANIINKNNFNWNTDFNISLNRNEIVELVTKDDDLLNQWFIGKPIQVNYDLLFDGVFQTDDDIASSAQPTAQPGHAKVRDDNGDGKIDANDRTFIGSLQPNYIWGMINTISYKNFSLNFFLQGVQGITRRNDLLSDDPAGDDLRRRYKINRAFWTPENPINDHWANNANANVYKVGIYEDASFIRLKDITLTYNIPNNLVSKIGLSQSRIHFNVRNALTFTKWQGLDPELNDQRAIPLQREFNVGLNFQF